MPKIIEIDKTTGDAKFLTVYDSLSFSEIWSNIHNNLYETFLPYGYPKTVGSQYLKFSMYSNLSSITLTTMTFLAT